MEPTVPVDEVTQKPSLLGIVTSPSAQFERMKGKVKLAVPMILLILLHAVFVGIIAYFGMNDPAFLKTQESLPPELKPAPALIIGFGIIGGVVGMVLAYFIGAAIYKLISMITGSDITYSKLLAILVYTSVIGLVGTILNVILMAILGGTEPIYTNLSSLFAKGTALSALGKALDIITIWQYIVIAIGLRIAGGLSKNKAIAIVVTIFVLSTLASVGLAGVSSIVPK